MHKYALYGLFFLPVLAGCGSPGIRDSDSVNHNSRVSIVVIHHTTANFEDSLHILTAASSNSVSSHYLIPEPDDASYDGSRIQTYQLVSESRRAWHAGRSYWAGKTGLNDQSIGIELVNQTYCYTSDATQDAYTGNPQRLCFFPDFADSQVALLVELLDDILVRHPDIRPTSIIGHADIAPERKIDPGPRFPWQRLYRLGYGAWFDDDTVIRYWEQFREHALPVINIQRALNAYGYGIEISGEADEQMHSVVRAFQMHFRPHEVTGEMTLDATAVLFALIEKYHPDKLEELLLIEDESGPGPDIPPDESPAAVAEST